jgi:hypothetical protein
MQGGEHMCGRYGAGADRSHALPPLVCEIVAARRSRRLGSGPKARRGAEVGAMSAPGAGLQAAGGADNRAVAGPLGPRHTDAAQGPSPAVSVGVRRDGGGGGAQDRRDAAASAVR